MKLKDLYITKRLVDFDDAVKWRANLVGAILPFDGTITRVFEWQIVPTGRPYEYHVWAHVEVDSADK